MVLSAAHQEPLVFPSRAEVESRLAATIAFWREWAAGRTYDGPWREAVIRSALALKLLIHSPSGAIAAAATASLPEQIGGERNWDYRFCWVRDSAFTLHALMQLGCPQRGRVVLLVAAARLAADASAAARPLPPQRRRARAGVHARRWRGYRGSRPGAGRQRRRRPGAARHLRRSDADRLALLPSRAVGSTRDTGRRLAEIADLVCELWRQPDCGIWEVRSEPLHFTHSKMMCWVALDRAVRLAERG